MIINQTTILGIQCTAQPYLGSTRISIKNRIEQFTLVQCYLEQGCVCMQRKVGKKKEEKTSSQQGNIRKQPKLRCNRTWLFLCRSNKIIRNRHALVCVLRLCPFFFPAMSVSNHGCCKHQIAKGDKSSFWSRMPRYIQTRSTKTIASIHKCQNHKRSDGIANVQRT